MRKLKRKDAVSSSSVGACAAAQLIPVCLVIGVKYDMNRDTLPSVLKLCIKCSSATWSYANTIARKSEER
jgi:hypothetical protein